MCYTYLCQFFPFTTLETRDMSIMSDFHGQPSKLQLKTQPVCLFTTEFRISTPNLHVVMDHVFELKYRIPGPHLLNRWIITTVKPLFYRQFPTPSAYSHSRASISCKLRPPLSDIKHMTYTLLCHLKLWAREGRIFNVKALVRCHWRAQYRNPEYNTRKFCCYFSRAYLSVIYCFNLSILFTTLRHLFYSWTTITLFFGKSIATLHLSLHSKWKKKD